MADPNAESNLKAYSPPKIVHTEKTEARAILCSQGDDTCAASGPIQS